MLVLCILALITIVAVYLLLPCRPEAHVNVGLTREGQAAPMRGKLSSTASRRQ